jgi:hypothetical protein
MSRFALACGTALDDDERELVGGLDDAGDQTSSRAPACQN